ncbi:MAG TPA: hypothetical protein VHT27_06070 [Solirubrobacteraceae bacterium]|nr:hypothetical protein [Solirubrobacteraceae bacterium]
MTFVCVGCLAGSASAGEWVQVSCVNPDASAAGSAGWSTMLAGGGYGSNAGSSCGPGNPAYALLSSAAAVPVGSAETLFYAPPSGSELNGGAVDVAFSAFGGGYDASGTAVAYTPEYTYDGANVFFQCAAGLAACSPQGAAYIGTLTLPGGRGGRLYLSAGCGGNPGESCDAGGSEGTWSYVRMYWAHLRLLNTSTPSGEGFQGTLLGSEARGSADLIFTALDRFGPGVYTVEVSADGRTLYSGTPDANGGSCVAVGSEAGALMFDGTQPCRESESVDLALDTTGLTDGTHTLKIVLTDAAGNRAVVYDAPFATLNAPSNLTPASVRSLGGAVLEATPGSWSAPAGAGQLSYAYQWQRCEAGGEGCMAIPGATESRYSATADEQGGVLRVLVTASDSDGQSSLASSDSWPVDSLLPDLANGLGASEHASLTLTGPSKLTCTYAKRALSLHGQLLGPGGAPIADATLELLSQEEGLPAAQTVAFASTGADGSFTIAAPAGPSRRLTVAYRAFSADATPSASASVTEAVRAALVLHVSPKRIGSTGSIVLSGRVAGPLPPDGVSVQLLVRYRGQWEPFRSPRTGPGGRFRVRYRFQGAVGRFPFEARVVSGQSGFPYLGTTSIPAFVRST